MVPNALKIEHEASHTEYLVWISKGRFTDIPQFDRYLKGRRHLALITDSNVDRLYADQLSEELHAHLKADQTLHKYVFEAGESAKCIRVKTELEEAMLTDELGRDTLVIALGGGVTTDLAGFIAATLMRGVDYLNIPTSLLAAADAAVGGKTGINAKRGKNLIGAFHHPVGVLINLDTWHTLPAVERRNGLAETVKHAAIADEPFLTWLEANHRKLREFADGEADLPEALALRMATRNVEIKQGIVMTDEKEANARKQLNFGHTIGHAIEALSQYEIPHGHAVSMGMAVEARLLSERGVLEIAATERLTKLLQSLGLPTALPQQIEPPAIIQAARHDKKNTQTDQIEFVRLAELGGDESTNYTDSLSTDTLSDLFATIL